MKIENTQLKRVSIRAKIKEGKGFPYGLLRRTYYSVHAVDVPFPKVMCQILWKVVSASVKAYYWTKSTFWVTPVFKGLCSTVGKNFKAGTFIPFVEGTGAIHVGDHVKFYGKQTFLFAAIRDAVPEICVGDNTGFGHNTVFDIAGKLTIGEHCMIASNVLFQDCSGHSIVAEIRAAGTPPSERDIKEIVIGDNVWIGTGAYILPGAVIGDNCVIAANTAVSRKIPNNSLVYALAPKVVEIRDISKMV